MVRADQWRETEFSDFLGKPARFPKSANSKCGLPNRNEPPLEPVDVGGVGEVFISDKLRDQATRKTEEFVVGDPKESSHILIRHTKTVVLLQDVICATIHADSFFHKFVGRQNGLRATNLPPIEQFPILHLPKKSPASASNPPIFAIAPK